MTDWEIVEPEGIRKIFGRLGQSEKDQYRDAIKTLGKSKSPRDCAEYKKWMKCFSYEITKNFRILFDYDNNSKTIWILKILDHKGSYGRDKKS